MIQKIFALIVSITILPIIFIISIIIFIFDGKPVFYKQKRIGKHNKEFDMYKFRTMVNHVGDIPKGVIKNPDHYITFTGSILRKFSIDELPQLLNIIKGDMNLIGYRPCLFTEKELISLRKEYKLELHKPGITGWAQVNGRDKIDDKTKAYLDMYYIKNKSIFFDIKIILLSIYVVITKKNVAH